MVRFLRRAQAHILECKTKLSRFATSTCASDKVRSLAAQFFLRRSVILSGLTEEIIAPGASTARTWQRMRIYCNELVSELGAERSGGDFRITPEMRAEGMDLIGWVDPRAFGVPKTWPHAE